jgi:ribonuclease P protein component
MERLKRRSDFRAVAQASGGGARAHASGFILQARAREKAGPPRIGFTVSRQVGNAVERNRVRRRLRELVRLAPATALWPGHDYVLIGRREALKLAFETMTKELSGALRRVHGSGKNGSGKNGSGKNRAGKNGAAQSGAGTGAAGERSPHRAGRSKRNSGQPRISSKTGPISTTSVE